MMIEIPLTKSRVALIDEGDLHLLVPYRWGYSAGGYAMSRNLYMHRVVAAAAGVDVTGDVDHINGNRLDNRRINLRGGSRSMNLHNRHDPVVGVSGIRGVRWIPHAKQWRADFQYDTVVHNVGYFRTKEAASEARETARRQLVGEWAR